MLKLLNIGQYPVSYEPESNLVSCPYCNFHFCLMCKATYHGVAPCKMTSGWFYRYMGKRES